jgi:hypothetical protein
MKKFTLTILFILLASPAWATSYFMAPASGGGNDSNSGTSASTPWLSPNHSVNCGDTITAAASAAYSASNFGAGKWGTVSCPSGNNVAWLICASFDGCKISSGSSDGMKVTASYWGVQGWEATTTSGGYGCFTATPSGGSSTIHHIIFANDIANGCQANGFNSYNSGSASVDYFAIVGDIAYNAAQGSGNCFSGISIYQPQNHDTAAGTHLYVAGNFSYGNIDASPCQGGTPSDGEGIIFDTFDGSQGGLSPYTQQAVAYNNILLRNGGQGFETFNNKAGSAHATIYAELNTLWGNAYDPQMNATYCGQMLISSAYQITMSNNLAMSSTSSGCGSNPVYMFYVGGGNSTDTISGNFGYSAAGQNCGVNGSSGFSCGTDTFGTNPDFANAVEPGAPSCGSATSVPNCMAAVVANFTPGTAAAKAYGYQPPSATQTNDPLFPQWLCTANLPPGLVTIGCLSSASLPAPPTNISAIVN